MPCANAGARAIAANHAGTTNADALMGAESDSELIDDIFAACLERVPRPEPDWEAGAVAVSKGP